MRFRWPNSRDETFNFGAACGVRCGSGYLSTLICKPQGPLLAGNIVQVRLERKALSAAVSPTCCSGREQRSKTAYAGSAIPSNKATLRKALRAERRSLGVGEHARCSARAAAWVTRSRRFKAGSRVAIYLPFDRETDTAGISLAAQRRGIRIYVPVITDLRHRRIDFYPLSGRTQRGVYGISVPKRRGPPTAARWLDLIVVPLVGVDAEGRRLGMGGGFYDRTLSFRRTRRHWPGPQLLGFGFDFQRVDSVFAEGWDIPLDGLATESGSHPFRHASPARTQHGPHGSQARDEAHSRMNYGPA